MKIRDEFKPNDPSLIRDEFKVHKLNAAGLDRANELAAGFSELLNNVEGICTPKGDPRGPGGRELALVRTHLEQASYYAKRAMALQPENQE